MKQGVAALLWCSCCLMLSEPVRAGEELPDQVRRAMKQASEQYLKLAVEGGYVYHCSLDGKVRWGEGAATTTQIWVQPPGTPTVGMAYLKAWEATGDEFYLQAATAAAESLVHGQLQSGGWTNKIDFDPQGDAALYRNGKGKPKGGRNYSSLDDGQTQSAIQLLIRVDQAHQFKHEAIHEAATVALDALLAAQFANGGFPQVWQGPAAKQPVVKANYPDYEWRTENRIKEYWNLYTLNDNVPGYLIATLIDAHKIYGEGKYKTAVVKLGDFLLLAQMPEPQPGWCQQYNFAMQPVWARAFEPPGVSGDETQETLENLLTCARFTGNAKYLEPFPAALAWLKKSRLPDNKIARYYELKTNKPLYMNRNSKGYFLTYDDKDLPDHYGWRTDAKVERLESAYQQARSNVTVAVKPQSARSLEEKVRQTLASLDGQGRWVSTYQGDSLVGQPKFRKGEQYLSSEVFSRNLELLSDYLQRTKQE